GLLEEVLLGLELGAGGNLADVGVGVGGLGAFEMDERASASHPLPGLDRDLFKVLDVEGPNVGDAFVAHPAVVSGFGADGGVFGGRLRFSLGHGFLLFEQW